MFDSALSEVKWYSKVLCFLGQFFCKLLSLMQSFLIWEVQCCLLGGHSQLLQESTQMVASTQKGLVGPSTLGLLVESVHQSLAHHNHKLTLWDKFFWWLAVLDAAYKSPNGLLEGTKVKPTMLCLGDWLMFFCATCGLRGAAHVISLSSEGTKQRTSIKPHIMSSRLQCFLSFSDKKKTFDVSKK